MYSFKELVEEEILLLEAFETGYDGAAQPGVKNLYDIFKTLSIERQYRMLEGKIYLDNTHTKYCNLIEQGNLLDKEKFEMISSFFSKELKQKMIKIQENLDPILNIEIENQTVISTDEIAEPEK
jgi:hypothetical protein